jgi:hypothetical protein
LSFQVFGWSHQDLKRSGTRERGWNRIFMLVSGRSRSAKSNMAQLAKTDYARFLGRTGAPITSNTGRQRTWTSASRIPQTFPPAIKHVDPPLSVADRHSGATTKRQTESRGACNFLRRPSSRCVFCPTGVPAQGGIATGLPKCKCRSMIRSRRIFGVSNWVDWLKFIRTMPVQGVGGCGGRDRSSGD